jgi:hypothetical protein
VPRFGGLLEHRTVAFLNMRPKQRLPSWTTSAISNASAEWRSLTRYYLKMMPSLLLVPSLPPLSQSPAARLTFPFGEHCAPRALSSSHHTRTPSPLAMAETCKHQSFFLIFAFLLTNGRIINVTSEKKTPPVQRGGGVS